ncbi:MAG TPA: S8 family serine peptidase, partial [Actinomycetota bacterium]|nr:S8 family serine peptidase [Actinomycetota bacterium]
AQGIRYAARRGADVINLSLYVGLIEEGLDDVLDAAAAARERGVVVVAAAGNNSEPWCVEPAASVICVGATDRWDRPATYSNRDVALQSSYLVAPGGAWYEECAGMVLSTTLPPNGPIPCAEGPHYARSFGTSAAAPVVAGVAALLAGTGADADEIERCILETAEDLGPAGRDPLFGYGRVDAARAVRCAL